MKTSGLLSPRKRTSRRSWQPLRETNACFIEELDCSADKIAAGVTQLIFCSNLSRCPQSLGALIAYIDAYRSRLRRQIQTLQNFTCHIGLAVFTFAALVINTVMMRKAEINYTSD